jgi:integrase
VKRSGGARTVRGKHYARVRIGEGRRPTIPLPGCATDEEAEARAAEIADVASDLVKAGRWFDVEQIARAMGAAKTPKELRIIKLAASRLAASGPGIGKGDETFAGFAELWTTGALAREYPDHVAKKDARGDTGILRLHVNPIIGHIPLVAFELEHADSVMRMLPSTMGTARRRHVAQVIHRVLAMATFPAKIIKTSPIPKGWLPKLGKVKALTYLYPDEDRSLLASPHIDLRMRMLYGFLAREGMRLSEALALDWTDVDVARGAVNLDENKTDDPRAWAMDPSVVGALDWWRTNGAPAKGPFKNITARHAAERLRHDLKAAGVEREALYRMTDKRRPMRAHDLRATFITISLANGRTESWVQDRTGHASTLMIARYRRAARTVAELGMGTLAPLATAIPEILGGAQVGQQSDQNHGKSRAMNPHKTRAGSPSRTRTGTPFRARDFKDRASPPTRDKRRQNRGDDDPSRSFATPDPHAVPHPNQTRPTWRATADAFEVFVAEEAGIRLPRTKASPKKRARARRGS